MKDYLKTYISANAYAMRTILLNEQVKVKLKDQIDHLQYEVDQIKRQLYNAKDHFESILKIYSKFQAKNEYKHESTNITIPFELQQLRTTNKLLKQELENVLLKKLNLIPSERIDHIK